VTNSRTIALATLALVSLIWSCWPATTAPIQQPQRPRYPDADKGFSSTRGAEPAQKLSSELVILFDQITNSNSNPQFKFDEAQLRDIFNLEPGANPSVGVTIRVSQDADVNDLKTHQAKIYLQVGDLVFADIPVRALGRLVAEKFVRGVTATKAVKVPPVQSRGPVDTVAASSMTIGPSVAAMVDSSHLSDSARNFTGRGVIVGVIDTGIDWKHEDFVKDDGTSRILYLWDMTDTSFVSSSGKIGSQPPALAPGNASGPGTLYTNKQINDALKGQGVVNSSDNFGHGTAVAGTAAGNGRATAKGVPAGSYKGVAPEADLIVVKAGDCGNFDDSYLLGAHWIAQVARERKQPLVINQSLGGHVSAHDGSEPAEQFLNTLSGAGLPGIALTVSAGNEGKYSLHASGRFGPRQPGQADVDGSPVEVAVSSRAAGNTWLNGYFDTRDDWGLVLRGSGNFLVDQLGRPFNLYIFKVKDTLKVQLSEGVKEPDYFKELVNVILDKSRLAKSGEKIDRLWLPLLPGNYLAWGFGATANVVNGSFELYTPFFNEGAFTYGAVKRMMVGSPGNAANVITVGSYDFRLDWANQLGGRTSYNLELENISDYSSPGGPRSDGSFKPEITAPARFTISSMSADANPDSSKCMGKNMGAAGWTAVTKDGKHMAWSGTSAAAPYVAGVVALMFEKNPNLDSAQIKNILIKTARRDDKFVGSVPNPQWGFGKVDPSAALASTPAATK
jgi:minor extracellular serine protease Vpr